MSSFFRTRIIDAADAADHGDAIRRMRREEFDGLVVRGVYDAAACAKLCARLEAGRHGLIRTEFPGPFRAYFLGVNLNLAPSDLDGYFAAAAVFRTGLERLFSGLPDLQSRVASLLGQLDDGRRYRPAPGPQVGSAHMFTTLRAHMPGGFIPVHFDNEQAARPSYRLLMRDLAADLFSFVLAFSQAEGGGALEIYNLRHGGRSFRMVDGAEEAGRLDLAGVESVQWRLAPGEMILFNSGRYLHRVTPVEGAATRWTACSFMAESRGGDAYCWG